MDYANPFSKRKMSNFQFALGMGTNWVDTDTGRLYHIQEYKEKLDAGEKNLKIRVTDMDGVSNEKWELPEVAAEKMKDPEPDPKYAPETAAERRREMRQH